MAAPTIFFLHALGASARSFDGVVARLEGRFPCVALDLPGYGDRAGEGYADVAAMVDGFAAEVAARAPAAWIVVGHSMGGKIATLAAARGLPGLAGVVLLAASPPSPEPIEEARRQEMLGWFEDGAIDEGEATDFVEANTASALPEPLMAQAVADVRRSHPQAWRGWLERGAHEDWSDTVGAIDVPAVVAAGTEDGDLGAEAQARLNLPHYLLGRLYVAEGAAHLLPYEAPDRVAAWVAEVAERAAARALPEPVAALAASPRTSARARRVLADRQAGPAPEAPGVMSKKQWLTLSRIVACTVPPVGEDSDLPRRIDATLATGVGDGWRFADLPPDAEAWARGLNTLADVPDMEAALRAAERGEVSGALTGPQMRLWFADVRAEIVRHWVALPATMARIGYDGFAVGGDGPRKQGYVRTAADDPEPWQLHPERAA